MNGLSHLSGRPMQAATLLAVFAGVLTPGVIALAFLLGGPGGVAVALTVFGAGAAMAVTGMAAHYPHDRPGGCNMVTMLRLGMVAGLAAAIVGAAMGWAVFAVAATALTLDGADGYLARRQRLASAFGARFDMEVDAALAATLSLILLAHGSAGVEVLILGFARYAFLAAGVALPWLTAPLDESLRRKAVCVAQIATLAALTAPAFPDAAARPCAIVAAALLAWSFARDIRRLAQTR